MGKLQDRHSRELHDAMAAHRGGNLSDAKTLYERVLSRRPNDPDALHFYGVLSHNLGRSQAAVELIRRSLRRAPSNAHAWINLGNICLELGEVADARSAYERAVESAPTMADAWYNLGICLRRASDPEAAVTALDRAIELAAQAPHFYQRGIAQREAGRFQAAEADFRAALERKPDYPEVYESLGLLCYRQGRIAEAGEVYRMWLAHDPHSSVAQHMAAATTGKGVPPRAPDRYVTEIFDRFAPTFEENLSGLGYRAPELVRATLVDLLGSGNRCRRLLDAGCGTGLCGAGLRPLTDHLVGVDLSSAMIERAGTKGVYDELCVSELCAFMRDRPAAFDAIVAADTFVYFGALSEAFSCAGHCLGPGGVIILTLEGMAADASEADYRIEPHGRYSHRLDYVRRAFEQASIDMVAGEERVLRRERGEDVHGLLVAARRRAHL